MIVEIPMCQRAQKGESMRVLVYKRNHDCKEYYTGCFFNDLFDNTYLSPMFESPAISRPVYFHSIKEFISVFRPGMHLKFVSNKNYEHFIKSL